MVSAALNDRQDGAPGQEAALQISMPDGSRPAILLAEDSAAARVLTAALLRRMGCDVDAVEHGEEALAHVQSFSYDLVLMDIEMPVMDGLVAAQEIRSLGGAAARTPIVALSAFMADERRANAWKNIFDGSMPKPAGKTQLFDLINSVLNKQPEPLQPNVQASAAAPVPATNVPMQEEFDVLVDVDRMNELRGKVQPDAWQTILTAAVNDLRSCVETMQTATRNGDPEGIRTTVHKLKGVANSFGMPEIARLTKNFVPEASPENGRHSQPISDLVRCCERTMAVLSASRTA